MKSKLGLAIALVFALGVGSAFAKETKPAAKAAPAKSATATAPAKKHRKYRKHRRSGSKANTNAAPKNANTRS